jgi:hypothetical protein
MDTPIIDLRKLDGQLVAQALADPAFRAELEADPARVLGEHGVPVPQYALIPQDGDPEAAHDLVLAPESPELSSDDLALIAGGNGEIPLSCFGTASTIPSTIGTASTIEARVGL